MLKKICAPLAAIALLSLGSCSKAYDHSNDLHSTKEKEMTLGIVQKEIRKGMPQADVAISLGSPNIISKDSGGKESWIYDKVAKEASFSQDQGGIWLILGAYHKESGAMATSQKNLTVVIKFDEDNLVDSVAYHSSKY